MGTIKGIQHIIPKLYINNKFINLLKKRENL